MPGLFDDPPPPPPKTVYERYQEECAATAKLFPPVPSRDGRAERDAAVARVERNADPDWLAAARAAALSIRVDTWTTDDVWAELDRAGLVETAVERRAMGAVLQALHRDGLIEPLDEFRVSTRPVCHRNPKRVWRRVR